MMNSPAEVAKNYVEIGTKKAKTPWFPMLILSIMAGMFIAFAGAGASTASATVSVPSLQKLISGLIFPTGLTMTLLAGSELFTGNAMLVIPFWKGRITGLELLRNWCIVYFGNFLGALMVCVICAYGHQLSLFNNALAVSTLSAGAAKCQLPFMDGLLKGIGCNFLVCIAVWISFAAKDVAGKIVGLFLPIMVFVVCGFEHCVANMFYVPVALMAKGIPMYAEAAVAAGVDLTHLTWGNFVVHNLISVTLGNLIGGALLVAGMYYLAYLNDR